MANSVRFEEMSTRLTELHRHLLPTVFSATGEYSDEELDRARGYRLLVHAEIEAYLEDISRAVVTNAIRLWKHDKQPTFSIIAFLASYHSGWSVGDDVNNEEIVKLARSRSIKDSIDEIIDLAQIQFIKKLNNNHGVREKNLKSLMLPTGVDIDDIDSTWITNLDDFGKLRGDLAHKTKSATDEINPMDEYTRVKSLLKGLQDLDQCIQLCGV